MSYDVIVGNTFGKKPFRKTNILVTRWQQLPDIANDSCVDATLGLDVPVFVYFRKNFGK